MFNGIVVNVIYVSIEILLISDHVIPVPILPNLATIQTVPFAKTGTERQLDAMHNHRQARFMWLYQQMNVLREHNPRQQREPILLSRIGDGLLKQIKVLRQQWRSAMGNSGDKVDAVRREMANEF